MLVGLVTGKHKIDLVEKPDPRPTHGKAVVNIRYCGICGTDVHAFQSGHPYNPAICGHEWTGTVSATGTGVGQLREGDRVAIGVGAACGHCATCRRGDAGHCETAFLGAIGAGPLAADHGGFACAIAFDANRLYRVVPGLSDIQAAILEPVTVAVHAVRRTPMRLGDSVVVIGAGPIGLLVMQAARAAGAGHVSVIEPAPARRQMAVDLGADLVIDPTREDAQAMINAALNQTGADVVFECAGIPTTIQVAVNLVRRGGAVSLVGVPNRTAEIDAAGWLIKEVYLTASIAYLHEEFQIAQDLVVDGRIDCLTLHTSTVGLQDLGPAFNRLASEPQQVKILVDPSLG